MRRPARAWPSFRYQTQPSTSPKQYPPEHSSHLLIPMAVGVVPPITKMYPKAHPILQLRAAVGYCIERSICPGVSRRPLRSGSSPRRISISLTRSCGLALIRVSASSVVVISFSTDAKTKSRFTSKKASRLTARRSWRRSSRVGRPKNQQPL